MGSISTVQDGTHSTPHYVEEGIPFFSVETITSDVPPKYISQEEHDNLIKRCKPKQNDILLTRIGTLCESKLITWDFDFSIYVSLALISDIQIYPEFLNQYIKTNYYKKEYIKRSLLLAVPQKINLKDLKETIVKFPSISEQKKIADFLDTIDRKIELLEIKLNDFVIFRKFLLDKLFCDEVYIPELRFGEFSGKWSSFKLNEIVNRVTRKNNNLVTELPLTISATCGLIDQVLFFNKQVASDNLKNYYLLKKGEFAYNKSYSSGYPYGVVKRLDFYDCGAVSTLYICFKNKSDVNSDFLKIYFETNKWYKEIYKIAVEGARNHGLLNISVNDFFNTTHKIPEITEQEKIADFLSLINQKIDLYTKKLNYMKSFKNSLLSKMFC